MSYKFKGDIARPLNRLAREQMKMKLLADIRLDIEICKIEGWDTMEYINDIEKMLDRIVLNYQPPK